MLRKLFFLFQYLFGEPPWDTGVSPPELMEFIEDHEPGRALDIGCGTGTNAITLADHGWRVMGVDFIPKAIRTARRKARRAGAAQSITFRTDDVLNLDPELGPFDLVLDIGCYHTFAGNDVRRYANLVGELLAPGGTLLLYAHMQEGPADEHGASEADIQSLEEGMELVHRKDTREGESRKAVWLTFRKTPAS